MNPEKNGNMVVALERAIHENRLPRWMEAGNPFLRFKEADQAPLLSDEQRCQRFMWLVDSALKIAHESVSARTADSPMIDSVPSSSKDPSSSSKSSKSK
jgi:hypothetical protein